MDPDSLTKIVIAGGSGFVGSALAHHFAATSNVAILSRVGAPPSSNISTVTWDGRTLGNWASELDGTDVLINLTGKNVNCRYNDGNKREILESRVLSTKVLGEAVARATKPPKVWIQMSSATIYRHSEDKPMDETFGEIGDDFSMNVCKDWERSFDELELNGIRRVVMRTSIVIGNKGGALPSLKNLVQFGLGGAQGDGKQRVSWIQEKDLVGVVEWMLRGNATGVYNVTAPQPVTNAVFMKQLRKAFGVRVGLPSPEWLLALGARLIGTETELILKSRWVIPKRLIQEGYRFKFPSLESAVTDLKK